MTKKLFVVFALPLALAACSDDSKEAVHNVRAAPDLQGSFDDTCSSSKLLDTSEQIQLNFEGNQYTRAQVWFSDADCKTETGRVEYKGEFKAGEESPETGGTLDLRVSEATIKVSSDTLAKALNTLNYCGHSDYAVGKEVVLSGAQTQGLCPIENVPTDLFTSYRLRDNNLILSDSDITTMSKDPANRTSGQATERIYTKR